MAGYFGKLPARADFVIGHCPKGFLKLWEPFLLRGLAQSRLDLTDSWQEAYMTMPIWQFNLALKSAEDPSAETPRGVAGAFMPSVDRVGREYPLTLVAEIGGDGISADEWFGEADRILLSALSDETTFEGFQTAVADLADPSGDTGLSSTTGRTLPAQSDTQVMEAHFRCRAGEQDYVFHCQGLPNAGEFHRLILPELQDGAGQDEAGSIHGRYHPEDHRT